MDNGSVIGYDKYMYMLTDSSSLDDEGNKD